MKIGLLELQAEAEELDQSESKGMNILIELILLLNLPQAPLDHTQQSHKQSQNNMETFWSPDFDSRVHITTPVFRFLLDHKHTYNYIRTSCKQPPKMQRLRLVVAYGRWSFTRIEAQGAFSEKRSSTST